jgi:serine/threonine protein kinase/class 3 adenylate cyclase
MSDGIVPTRVAGATVRPANADLAVGEIIAGRYRLDQFLSAGGMGRVWQATHHDQRRRVAIKLMHDGLVSTDYARKRFLLEAQSAANLKGPNVVSLLDAHIDPTRGIPYLTMELLEGEDLSRRLSRGPLSYPQTLAVLTDVCAAITEAHAKGIVHRDLKPANIFLVEGVRDVVAKVLDFGIVKSLLPDEVDTPAGLTMSGAALGTVTYMSPEQAENAQQVDQRADLWSIGAVVFECLTGKRAFLARSLAELRREANDPRVVPSKKIDNLPPGFDEWFARATHINIERRFQNVGQLLDAFVDLGKPVKPPVSPPPPGDKKKGPTHGWISDANQIDINELPELTFKNKVVTDFLDSTTKYFVIGSKGLGKTLLLTYKRSLLNQHYQGNEPRKAAAVQFIPEGRPYLDLMGDLPSVGKAGLKMMSTLDGCKRLWSFAFRVSAISHLVDRDRSADKHTELALFPTPIRTLLEGRKSEPTVVLKELIALPIGELKQMLDRGENYLEYRIRSHHSAVYIFVDKLDQALSKVGREVWIAMQAGMIEAAWDLMNTNAHVKIFATIREEAFADYESDIKNNLHGATTALRYSKQDLREMLEKLTNFYEHLPLRDFINVDTISSSQSVRTEPPFEFIHRHTLGRPRDLVIIAAGISRNRGSLDEQGFTDLVREASAGMLVANVFNEMRVFLEVLQDKAKRNHFLAMLPHDILTEEEVIEIWCRFHGFEREYYDLHGNQADGVYHPFRELFDCGLLGVIQHDPTSGKRSQRFRQPHNAVGGSREALPPSSHYLLHPALQALILQQTGGGGFRPFRHVLIGHGEPWPSHYGRVIEVQRELWRGAARGDEDTEDAVYGLLNRFHTHVAAGEDIDAARRLIAATSAFRELTIRLERIGWDELHVALLELFPMHASSRRVSPEAGREQLQREQLQRKQADEDDDEDEVIDEGPPETTHRATVAMLLIDIVDSTALVERHGDTMLVNYLREIRDKLIRAPNNPARVIKGTGDGFLVVYDNVAAALLAVRMLDSAAEPGGLRMVVHCGEVRLGAADVYGAEVHRLFRLEKLDEHRRVGPPGGITLPTPGRALLSSAAFREVPLPEQATYERVGSFRIKGFKDPAEVWIDIGPSRSET